MRAILAVAALAALAAGCGGAVQDEAAPTVPSNAPNTLVRSPSAPTDRDTSPENLASAVVTYNFGQLPRYIDGGAFRLLPYDVYRAASPGETVRRDYDLTVPRTALVLDTVVTSALTEAQVREDSHHYGVGVTIDGRRLDDPKRYWVYYRNNGPQICRIYFPGDLGALNMGVHSLVFPSLPAGSHVVRVAVRERIPGSPDPVRFLSVYRLSVLARGPNAKERAEAPDEEEGERKAVNRTPLAFRVPQH
ncbi:MAG TPA: hypothetical protein VH416_04730 [Gaiellaceae bacterium]|jgi:hypothetical protein